MRTLATWSYRHRRAVLLGWLLIVVALFGLSRSVGTRYSSSFQLPNTDSTRATQLLQADAPRLSGDTEQVVVASRAGVSLSDPAARAQVQSLLAKIASIPEVTGVVSPYAPQAADQINAAHTVAFASVSYAKPENLLTKADATTLVDTVRSFATSQLSVAVEGRLAGNANSPSLTGTLYGVIAAGVVLFLVFGSLLAMSLPLLSALLALLAASSTIGMLSHVIGIPDFSSQLVPLIGLGVGVDYALFIVTRFRQGLQVGLDPETAVVTSVETSGRAVLFAGAVVCIALLGMIALGISVLSGVGVAASIAVLFTMATSLTLLPAMLGFMGERVLSRRQRRSLHPTADALRQDGRWWRWSASVARRPAVPALVALVIVGALAVPFFSLRLGATDSGSDPAGTTTRQAYEMLARGFGPGFNEPLQMTARIANPSDHAAVDRVTAAVSRQPGVASVSEPRYLTGPAGEVVTFLAFPTTSPQASATTTLLGTLRSSVIPPAEAGSTLRVTSVATPRPRRTSPTSSAPRCRCSSRSWSSCRSCSAPWSSAACWCRSPPRS